MSKAYITYGDVAQGAPAVFAAQSDDAQEQSDMLNAVRPQPLPMTRYGTIVESNQILLNDEWEFAPESKLPQEGTSWGFISNSKSGEDFTFRSPPVLRLVSPRQTTSEGIRFDFDAPGQSWATHIRITWLRDEEILDEQEYKPGSVEYYAENQVLRFNEVRIEILAWLFPGRFARINNVQLGAGIIVDRFTDISVRQEISPISAQISINTFDFITPLVDDLGYNFTRGQRINAFFGEQLIGVFFVQEINRMSENNYQVKCTDYLSILDAFEFPGGIYTDKSAKALIEEIFAAAFVPVSFEAYDINLSGWMPYATCRESLVQVCFAAGYICDTSFSDVVRIFNPNQTPVHVLNKSTLFLQNTKFTEIDPPSAVSLAAYSYYLGNDDEDWSEIYNADKVGETGEIKVIFGTAFRNLKIEDGEILSSGDNYANIIAGPNCILTGTPYFRTVISTRVSISEESTSKQLDIVDPTLVTRQRVPRLLDNLFSYYRNIYAVSAKTTNEDVRLGDVVSITGTYMGTVRGTVEKMEYRLNGNKFFPTIQLSVRPALLHEEFPRAGYWYSGEDGLW